MEKLKERLGEDFKEWDMSLVLLKQYIEKTTKPPVETTDIMPYLEADEHESHLEPFGLTTKFIKFLKETISQMERRGMIFSYLASFLC